MRFSVPAFILSLFSTTISTSPVPQLSGINDPSYQWQVTGWNAGCAHLGCFYDFNITGSVFDSIPAFSAYCSGYENGYYGAGSNVTPCKNLDLSTTHEVAVKVLPHDASVESDGAHIVVSYRFDVGVDAYFNYTGYATHRYNQFVSGPEAFLIEPSEVFGVA